MFFITVKHLSLVLIVGKVLGAQSSAHKPLNSDVADSVMIDILVGVTDEILHDRLCGTEATSFNSTFFQ